MRSDRNIPGVPGAYYREGVYFKFDCVPSGSAVGKDVVYFYFKLPATISTSYPNNKLWIPSPYDLTLFVNKVVERVYADRKNEKYLYYKGLADAAYVGMWGSWKYHYQKREIVDSTGRHNNTFPFSYQRNCRI
jgi:hypothetical protein